MSLSPMDYWRLASSLSVVNCAILITGNDPSKGYRDQDSYDWVQDCSYEGFTAAIEALKDAILTNELSAAVAFPMADAETSDREGGWGINLTAVLSGDSKVFELRGLHLFPRDHLVFLQKEPDWNKTMIAVRDVKAWLESKGVFPEFFFPQGDPDSFMNKDHAIHPSLHAPYRPGGKSSSPPRTKHQSRLLMLG